MEGDSTTSLGNLFQCSVTLKVKNLFPVFRWMFMSFSLWLVSLVLLLDASGKGLAPSFWQPPLRYLHAFWRFLLLLLLTTDAHSCKSSWEERWSCPSCAAYSSLQLTREATPQKWNTNPSSLSLSMIPSIYYFFFCLSPSLMVSGRVKVLSDKKNS